MLGFGTHGFRLQIQRAVHSTADSNRASFKEAAKPSVAYDEGKKER